MDCLNPDGRSNTMERKIKRGDIYYANLNPIIGSEQGGMRLVIDLVLQGEIQAFGVFVDTILICSATGFIVLLYPDFATTPQNHVFYKSQQYLGLMKI